MPVARIITDHPERTDALSRQLETQGYTVEVVLRRAAVASPADLEIDFEIWPEERVLDHAAGLAEELHADVAVAPGLELDRMEAAPPQPGPSPAEEPKVTAPLPPVQFAQPEPVPVEMEPVANLAAVPPAPPVQAAPAIPQEAAQGVGQERELEPDEVYFVPEPRGPGREAHAAVMQDTLEQQTASAGFLPELWKALGQVGREVRERWRIHLAEKNAEREERLLELTERKTLAQVRANELQAAREAASARLKELVRAGGTEPAPAQASPAEETGPAFVYAQPEPRLSALRRMLGRRSSPQVQAILTGVAAVIALFVLGMAIASFRPRPALSNSLDQPYKGVTVQTGGKTVTGAEPAPEKTKNTPRPSPAVRSGQANGKQSPAHHAANDVTVQRAGSGASTGSDVTVRRMGTQQTKPAAKATPQGGMKHISDLDN